MLNRVEPARVLWSTAERELRAYIDALGNFSRNARLYLWVAFLGGFTVGVTRIIFNLYIQALGFDAAFLGQLLAVTTAAAGITALPAGLLTDRWGTKRALVWGSLGVGCGAFGQMVLTTPLLLLTSGALAGAGGAIALAAQAPFLAHNSSRRERTYLFSTMAALFLASSIVGNLLGGHVPQWLQDSRLALSEVWSYRATLLAAGAASAFTLPVLLLLRETYQPGGPETRRWTLTRRSTTALAKLITTDGLISLGAGLTIPFLNVFFVQELGTSAAFYGTMSAASLGLRVATTLVAPVLATRLGPVPSIALTQLSSVPLLLLIGFPPALGFAAAAYVLRTSLMNMAFPVRDSFAMTIVDQSSRATVTAALLVTNNLAAALSTAIGGQLISAFGYRPSFLGTAVLYVLAASAFALLFRGQAGLVGPHPPAPSPPGGEGEAAGGGRA